MITWLYGRPSSGKTTIATGLIDRLENSGYKVVHLDGDCVRKSLSSDLGYTQEDRLENVKRIASLANLIHHAKQPIVDHVLISSIAPKVMHREMVKRIVKDVLMIRMDASLEECRRRDVKGLYKEGATNIEEFEISEDDVSVPTDGICEQESIDLVLKEIWKRI
jgi:adenylylsulfate kinase-like enzyme